MKAPYRKAAGEYTKMSRKFKTGDVVQDTVGGPEMTVDEYQRYPINKHSETEVVCTWFVGTEPKKHKYHQDQLNLIKSGQTTRGTKFKVGDNVKLNSGGPSMSVQRYKKFAGDAFPCILVATWNGDAGPIEETFRQDVLELD